MLPTWLDDPTVRFVATVLIPIATFVLGFFTSRLTMTKKERKDVQQKQFENSKALMEAQFARFQEFSAALNKYVSKAGEPTLDDFFEISTVGERYFYQQQVTSDAILAGNVDQQSRDNTLVPRILETAKKSLPTFYEVLQKIAKKKGFEYNGVLKRENYASIYQVVEKYGKLD
jgi:hypothetical protein